MRILITGAARRLGAEMAKNLAEQGAQVAVHYHNSADDADALVQSLLDSGHKAVALQADLRERSALAPLVERASAALGGALTGLINNASSFHFDRIDGDQGFEEWDQNFATNLTAPYFLTKAFAKQCEGEGFVINMIDQRVLRPTPNYASYALAKSALYTLTQTAAMALAPQIRVNGIGPGTTLIGAHQTEENFAHHRRISILERGADVEDILQAMNYLINARNVTGQMIAVDGGQHLIWQLPE